MAFFIIFVGKIFFLQNIYGFTPVKKILSHLDQKWAQTKQLLSKKFQLPIAMEGCIVHWISRRIGVGLEEAPSLHSHAGQVFNALLSTTLSFESDPDFRHLCSLSFILIIYHLQAIRELTGRYFGQVSHRVKKKLATIYKNDFLMFGYNPLIWVGEKISFIIDSVILLNFGAVGELNFFHQNFEWS